jgi:ABC-type lipoprotein export system ATPase subunit
VSEGAIVLEGRSLHRRYSTPAGAVDAVHDVSLEARAGTITAVVGPSGSGKSTLLRLLACLERPDAGVVLLDGAPIHDLAARARRALRRRRIAFLGAEPARNLLLRLDAGANLRAAARWRSGGRCMVPSESMLAAVGLEGRAAARIADLSTGEQQRLALAAATVGSPDAVVADEPTASLGRASVAGVVATLTTLATRNIAVIVATHDPAVIDIVDHVVQLDHGRIVAG